MAGERLLIVEDDPRLARLLVNELAAAGYAPSAVHTGSDALAKLEEEAFELVILDLNLPDLDGLEVAHRVAGQKDTSILMLTARGDVESRVQGLYAGASDYVTKPFSLKELLARVHARLRERKRHEDVIRVGTLELDRVKRQCRVDGAVVPLTAREYALLELLLVNRGRIFSKEELEDRLYGMDLPASNTIEVFISNLRRKLAARGVQGLITTVRGMGYVVR
ncbi:response regulator transcription factor [Marinithermus hydrothermalis]|uniref:Two component transcriptional regulator, winged helix family n=1 Tax=Marinithermus hydrothermalis (strain DSM 14884 / JCM 11576 / T1) TaxID=869210 RepID=F2NKL5_MARHT|nr:response regulator transcription factor [Marinithermus hydrothermalis]AEB12675.1 two component transcriptional regulator, winged helix family [Marinithermus hydrothermalis DSM 14884]